MTLGLQAAKRQRVASVWVHYEKKNRGKRTSAAVSNEAGALAEGGEGKRREKRRKGIGRAICTMLSERLWREQNRSIKKDEIEKEKQN